MVELSPRNLKVPGSNSTREALLEISDLFLLVHRCLLYIYIQVRLRNSVCFAIKKGLCRQSPSEKKVGAETTWAGRAFQSHTLRGTNDCL